MFGPKDSPATVVGALPGANHHDPWNRLHGAPSGFPAGPSWAKGPEKRDERERGKEGERRDIPHIKDEKDRSADPNTGFNKETTDLQCLAVLKVMLKVALCSAGTTCCTADNLSECLRSPPPSSPAVAPRCPT